MSNLESFVSLLCSKNNASRLVEQIDKRKVDAKHPKANFADTSYISNWGFLLSDDAIERIESFNHAAKGDDELNQIVESLYLRKVHVTEYIRAAHSMYMQRYIDEYRYIIDLGLQSFPYRYICDYSGSALPSIVSRTPQRPISIDFIYCIKRRQTRTWLSVTSLIDAFEAYIKRTGNPLIAPTVTIVEDISDDIFDFDLVRESDFPIRRILVETGVSWSRSKLLNSGLVRSRSEVVGFVDADFLFDRSYFESLSTLLTTTDMSRHVYAINLVETETHTKNRTVYSRGSPYSYMWLVDRRFAEAVSGFDEGYVGHGFEDRDFEMKLKRICGLTVTDSISVCPAAVVLHLSHESRDGYEMQTANRDRFLSREREPVSNLVQEKWGEVNVHSIEESVGFAVSKREPSNVDFLFIAHNRYHAESFLRVKRRLEVLGHSAVLLDIREHYLDEGAYMEEYASSYIDLNEILAGRYQFAAIACMNDWERKIAAPILDFANARGIPTIGIVEGVNDFQDVDTKRRRSAYRRVRHVLLNGEFDRRYFRDTDQTLSVCGVQRLDGLLETARKIPEGSRKRRVVVNVNFTYGVLEEYREEWIEAIRSVTSELGIDMLLSVHRAEKASLSKYNVSAEPLYTLLEQCEILVSRFSGVILEALVLKANVIYFNPGFEKVDKFIEPEGAYWTAASKEELKSSIAAIIGGERKDPSKFLRLHADISRDQLQEPAARASLGKTCEALCGELTRSEPTFQVAWSDLRPSLPWLRSPVLQEPELTTKRRPAVPALKSDTLFLVISCVAYVERRAFLRQYYEDNIGDLDSYVFIVGGADTTRYDSSSRTLHLACGDSYEDLPEKVFHAFGFAARKFDFKNLIKVDDDVVFNFHLLSRIMKKEKWPYFGKMIPSKRGAKPSPTWHFGKVSDRSPFYNKPFNFEGGVHHWACGGMYALTKSAAAKIGELSGKVSLRQFLYEDHMVGVLLKEEGINPTFIQDTSFSSYSWIVTDLREIMDVRTFSGISVEKIARAASVHCGPYPPFYSVGRDQCVQIMRDVSKAYKGTVPLQIGGADGGR